MRTTSSKLRPGDYRVGDRQLDLLVGPDDVHVEIADRAGREALEFEQQRETTKLLERNAPTADRFGGEVGGRGFRA
jgi:hypothetical protein